MGDIDYRFSKEIRNAENKFGGENIEHGVSFFEDTRYDGIAKIVFKEENLNSIDVLNYIQDRDNLKVYGGGVVNDTDITVARVL